MNTTQSSPASSASSTEGMARSSPALNFVRHYAEMLAAMFIGMFVLGGILGALLGLVGVEVSDWRTEQPELMLLGMAFTMSVPMVAWMRHRGHGWAPAWEMTASMFVPSLAAIALLWMGLVQDSHTLLGIQHVGMPAGMLAVMLLRRDEYTRHVGHGRRSSPTA